MTTPRTSTIPFNVNWLQSLTLAVQYPATLQVKPLITDIDTIGSFQPWPARLEAAKRLWSFAEAHALLGLLDALPWNQSRWHFPSEDRFFFEPDASTRGTGLEPWLTRLGAQPTESALRAEITQLDWTELLRKEMMHHGRSLNMSSMPTGKVLSLPCRGVWDGNNWEFRFEDPEWLVVKFDERFVVPRPALSEMEEGLQWSLAEAWDWIDKKKKCPAATAERSSAWTENVASLQAWHEKVLTGLQTEQNAWGRRIWECVWPVIYREENRLRADCDLGWLRAELAECFRDQPKLTLWMFVFAKLLCKQQIAAGLSACGEFR